MIKDLTSNHNRTSDFLGTRANFIQERIKALASVFAAIVFLWILLDYLIIRDTEVVIKLAILRTLCATLYLGLAFRGTKFHDLTRAQLKLAALVALPCLFYIASRSVLEDNTTSGALLVYSFFPFVVVVQLAIFPLPLVEGLLLAIPAFVTLIALEYHYANLLTLVTWGDFVLLILLTCLALWASMSELQMLLRLYRQATRDPLTRLFNRGALMERMHAEVERSRETNQSLCVLLFDLDRFKRINDEYGHLTGDSILQTFARILEETLTPSGHIGRYGGEEFLVVLPETNTKRAEQLAEKVRRVCSNTKVAGTRGHNLHFTTSVGVAQLKADEAPDVLLRRVDESLYEAKQAGRDRVILAA